MPSPVNRRCDQQPGALDWRTYRAIAIGFLAVDVAGGDAAGVLGTLLALMLPFAVTLLVVWTLFLIGFWALGIPLGVGSSYVYPVP